MWNVEKAWDWYNSIPWIRGCNFIGSDCVNYIEQWQELGFEEHFETAKRELALVAQTGFNTVRLILSFTVWREQHDGFFERFDRYLQAAYDNGIRAIVVLGNDCVPPKGPDWRKPQIGVQPCDMGYHGGRRHSQHGTFSNVGYHFLDEPELAPLHYEFVEEIVSRHKDDERILMWDVYNEVGNSNRENITLPHLKKYFEAARSAKPSQPLTCCVWSACNCSFDEMPEVQRYALLNSDIISFHSYAPYLDMVRTISWLKSFGRPIVNTEWLARCFGSSVRDIFPLFFLEKIGCCCWGFVAGKTQTYEPWNCVWDDYESGRNPNIDFTKWFHDLYRPSLRPYDPKEIEIIKRFCGYADRQYTEKRNCKEFV